MNIAIHFDGKMLKEKSARPRPPKDVGVEGIDTGRPEAAMERRCARKKRQPSF